MSYNEKENMEKMFKSMLEIIKPMLTDVINEYAKRTEHRKLPIMDSNILRISLYYFPSYMVIEEAFKENKEYSDKLNNEIVKLGKELYPNRFFDILRLSEQENRYLINNYGEKYMKMFFRSE